MATYDYSITFACYNQANYTRQCVDSLVRHGADLARVVAVDNGSTDDTRAYLETLPLGGRIFNKINLGCGVAWNQGALALQTPWTIVMNNDVLASPGWIEGLIGTAEDRGLKIISPSMIEGDADYDPDVYLADASARMKGVLRANAPHAVCVAIHESVWMDIGYFASIPKLWGYEDTLFFHAARKANILSGITGASWLHHFGSITQTAMKRERGLTGKQGLSGRHNYRLLNESWLERKLQKMRRIRQLKDWRSSELAQYGMTLHGVRKDGQFTWL
ncbi:MAG: glycosyltransferase family 2 protein [Rhodocyclaceae bacterium]